MPQKNQLDGTHTISAENEKKMQAFKELDAARAQIKMYLPDDFDPDKELEEARAEKYGSHS